MNLNDPKARMAPRASKKALERQRKDRGGARIQKKAGGRSSTEVTVFRHDPSCPLLHGGSCACVEVTTETIRHVRVCAVCAGDLKDRRRTYCSKSCRSQSQMQGKTRRQRQERDQEYQARAGP